MTILQYEEYSELMKRATALQNQLRYMNEKAHSNEYSKDVPIHEMGWISLSYGNGSWRHAVLDNEENVKEISKLIIKMLEKELTEVRRKMKQV